MLTLWKTGALASTVLLTLVTGYALASGHCCDSGTAPCCAEQAACCKKQTP